MASWKASMSLASLSTFSIKAAMALLAATMAVSSAARSASGDPASRRALSAPPT
jgi:hypothetical protein